MLLLVAEETARVAVGVAAEGQGAALEVVQLPDPELVWPPGLGEPRVEVVCGRLWR